MVRACNGDFGPRPADLAAVAHLTPRQLAAVCVVPRDENGALSFPPVAIGRPMGGREAFRYRCFLLGVRDPDIVERLWREEQERR